MTCRQGVRVGVLSGPGHCTKSSRRYGQRKSSVRSASVAESVVHSSGRDSAPALGRDNRFLAVQFDVPRQVGPGHRVRRCFFCFC